MRLAFRAQPTPGVLALVTVCATLSLAAPHAAAAQPAAAASRAAVAPADLPAELVDRSRTNELVELVNSDPTAFAGITFDESTRSAIVRYPARAGRDQARDRLGRLAATRPGRAADRWRVSFAPVRYSQGELDAVHQRLTADTEWRRLAGPWLSQWYVDVERNLVVVGLTKVTAAVRAAATRKFGTMVELRTEPRANRSSRRDSSEPWHGGIELQFPDGDCTSGFVIERVANPNDKRMVTAGHCGAIGSKATNDGDAVGTMVDRSFTHNGLDVGYLGGRPYFPGVYVGSSASEDVRDIRGTQTPALGLIFCTDGAFAGELCAGKVTATNMCTTFGDGITTCKLARLTPPFGVPIIVPGDSGGPVISHAGDFVLISGAIVGFAANNDGFYHPFNTVIPAGWRMSFP